MAAPRASIYLTKSQRRLAASATQRGIFSHWPPSMQGRVICNLDRNKSRGGHRKRIAFWHLNHRSDGQTRKGSTKTHKQQKCLLLFTFRSFFKESETINHYILRLSFCVTMLLPLIVNKAGLLHPSPCDAVKGFKWINGCAF